MEVNLNIEEDDIKFVKDYLKGKIVPIELDDVVYHLALFKTEEKRKNRVKLYNPNCEYKVGDLIYKEYLGKLPVGAKKYIEMTKGVVLRVIDLKSRIGIDEVKLSYEGTSVFRKYMQYLERQKIELLLPHKQSQPCEATKYLSEKKDPRQEQDPLVEKDFMILRKKLLASLNKELDVALISGKVLLNENLKSIEAEVFNKIREFLNENKRSQSTQFFVENFIKIKPDDEQFDSFCFGLNYRMKKDFKIDFQQTNLSGWGKWNLISIIYYMRKNSLISEENPLLTKITLADKKSLHQKRKKFEETLFSEGHTRYFLTQREISSGSLKLKTGIYDFGESIEIEVVDGTSKKPYVLHHYSDANLMLGFKEIYEQYKALQGAILTLEQLDEDKFSFNFRTTKKGTIADQIVYDSAKKAFRATEERVASPVFVNKSIFLESVTINSINERIEEFRKVETLNKLVHKIFLEFGIKEKNYEIHILRLYHIIDLIYPVDLRIIEDVILSNLEFIPSDKLSGVFYLDSDAVIEIENEEKIRRELLLEEKRRKREEMLKSKLDEELKVKEEIRLKREDRRRKREEEMWMKDKLRKEKEVDRDVGSEKEKVPAEKRVQYKTKDDIGERKGAAIDDQDLLKKTPVGEIPRKRAHSKKIKKRYESEKQEKTKRRVTKKPSEDKLDIDEIKEEIKLEKLKDDLKEKEKKEKKEKAIAYKDDGSFGGILASKLDEVVEKKEKKVKVKKSKK